MSFAFTTIIQVVSEEPLENIPWNIRNFKLVLVIESRGWNSASRIGCHFPSSLIEPYMTIRVYSLSRKNSQHVVNRKPTSDISLFTGLSKCLFDK